MKTEVHFVEEHFELICITNSTMCQYGFLANFESFSFVM